jgi:hypothetical protein
MQSDPDRAALEAAARRFHERQLADPPAELAKLIHADAEMALVVTDLTPLRGRDEIREALQAARTKGTYSARVYKTDWLDSATLLLSGQAGFTNRAGYSSSSVWWLDEFKERLLWRVQAFRTEQEAREAYLQPA